LEAIADVLARHDKMFVLSDEIYEYINFTGSHASLAAITNARERTVTVNGFSKGFAMTGWRLGYMGAPKWLADACTRIQANVTSGASSFAQVAACVALGSDRNVVHDMVDAYKSRRDIVTARLAEIPGVKVSPPHGSFYVFPDISRYLGPRGNSRGIAGTIDFCDFLLDEYHLACVPGEAFGDAKCIRLSFAASIDELTRGLERLRAALASLS
jgi:aspartate aminotransferase